MTPDPTTVPALLIPADPAEPVQDVVLDLTWGLDAALGQWTDGWHHDPEWINGIGRGFYRIDLESADSRSGGPNERARAIFTWFVDGPVIVTGPLVDGHPTPLTPAAAEAIREAVK